MTAPKPHPLASADLRVAHRWMEPCECPPDFCSCPAGDPRSVIAALVQEVKDWRETFGAGRLLPPDTDTRTEYAVRMTWDDGSVTYGQCDRRRAEVSVAYHAKRRAEGPWRTVSAEVVERTVITSSGPWRPVPSTPTKES